MRSKWEVVHPEAQRFDFSQADQIVDFAARHGMKVRGHTLVWHRQNPTWLAEGNYTSSELAAILKITSRPYRALPGQDIRVDVVNEAYR